VKNVTGFVHHIPRQRPDQDTGELIAVETDDIAAAWFQHESGVRGQWFVSRATPPYAENGCLEVIGPDGALRASLSRGTVDRLQISRPQRSAWEEAPLPAVANDGKPHCLDIMMRSFVDACLRGKIDDGLDASFRSGLAAQQAIAAVLAANHRLVWVPIDHST
jgi:predicted dehydrogenase